MAIDKTLRPDCLGAGRASGRWIRRHIALALLSLYGSNVQW